MTSQRRRALLFAGVAVATSAGAHWWRPRLKLADTLQKIDLEQMFPSAFGPWAQDKNMPVQLVSPDQQAVLSQIYNQTLSRTYVNRAGQRIMLSVAYGGDQSDATRAHRPEVCYPAQGFQIRGDRLGHLVVGDRNLRARQLVAVQGGRIEPITYWVTVGTKIAASGTDQKLAQLSYSTRGIVPDGMLVRVSNISPDAEQSYQLHQAFVSDMAKGLSAPFVDRVFGAVLPAPSLQSSGQTKAATHP